MNSQAVIDEIVNELKEITSVRNVLTEYEPHDEIPTDQFPTLVVLAGDEPSHIYDGAEYIASFRIVVYGYILCQNNHETELNTLKDDIRNKLHETPLTNDLTLDKRIVDIRRSDMKLKPRGWVRVEIDCPVHEVITSR